LASNFGRLAHPYKLTYVVTKECHSKCIHCEIWKIKPKNELTLDELTSFAKKNPYFSWVDFTGGEPTDRDDFVEVVETFIAHCSDLLLVHFPTNGLKPKRIESAATRIAQKTPTPLVVTVSIDGPRELNDRLRGIPGDFERATETFNRLRKVKRVKVFVGLTLFKDNVDLIEQALEELKKVIPGFSNTDLHINLPHTSEHYYENETTAPKATLLMVEKINEVRKMRGLPLSPMALIEQMYQKRVSKYISTGSCPSNCASLLSSCFLSETGTVYPCSIWNEALGNIRDYDYSLQPILELSKTKELRERLLKKDCPNCWTPCEAYTTLAANLIRPF
jgi:MoaA/NifB/PqqE/SkfB family radical SAM enzyme